MAKIITSCVFFLLFIISTLLTSPCTCAASINVVNFGAKPDGQSDSTQPFLQAWTTACNSMGPSTIYVPRGGFLIRPIVFSGPCRNTIQFQIDGTIVAPFNYRALGNSGFWILFIKVTRVSIHGGTLDARGAAFWACRMSGNNCPVGARSITFFWSNNIMISGLTSINSQVIHVAIDHCNNLMIQNMKIIAPSQSPNTDGIHVQYSNGVTITSTTIGTGDDCISIGPGTKNLWIERIGCGPGHGISVGSLGNSLIEEGVENVTVTRVVFTNTENGVRIKSWGRPSSGYARNIVFRNIIVRNVANPIIIDQKYCPDNNCPHQSSGVKISEVRYKKIKGTSATEAAVTFDCSSNNPCRGIRLQDIKLMNMNGAAATTSSCSNAYGSATGVVIPKTCL